MFTLITSETFKKNNFLAAFQLAKPQTKIVLDNEMREYIKPGLCHQGRTQDKKQRIGAPRREVSSYYPLLSTQSFLRVS